MSQQEDDLRALAKIMDFLRAVSIILVVMNVYCLDLASAWIVMALGIIGSVNETPVNQIHYHILPHFTFL